MGCVGCGCGRGRLPGNEARFKCIALFLIATPPALHEPGYEATYAIGNYLKCLPPIPLSVHWWNATRASVHSPSRPLCTVELMSTVVTVVTFDLQACHTSIIHQCSPRILVQGVPTEIANGSPVKPRLARYYTHIGDLFDLMIALCKVHVIV